MEKIKNILLDMCVDKMNEKVTISELKSILSFLEDKGMGEYTIKVGQYGNSQPIWYDDIWWSITHGDFIKDESINIESL